MNEEEQLLTTGRVIDATRKIESKLVACGAVGSGLREKAESLGDRLPAEAARLIRFIGSVRNRFAHESGARLRPDELELFEEAAEAVLAELDSLPEPVPPEKSRPQHAGKPSALRPFPKSKMTAEAKTTKTPALCRKPPSPCRRGTPRYGPHCRGSISSMRSGPGGTRSAPDSFTCS